MYTFMPQQDSPYVAAFVGLAASLFFSPVLTSPARSASPSPPFFLFLSLDCNFLSGLLPYFLFVRGPTLVPSTAWPHQGRQL